MVTSGTVSDLQANYWARMASDKSTRLQKPSMQTINLVREFTTNQIQVSNCLKVVSICLILSVTF